MSGRPRKVRTEEIENEVMSSDSAQTMVMEAEQPAVIDNKLEKELSREIVKTEDGDYTLEVIKDYYGRVDPFYLSKKDPNYEYRFLRYDDKNLSLKTGNLLFQQGGWQMCLRQHLVKIGIAERFISSDGLYRVGENVLAFMPKKLFQEKEADRIKKANAPMEAIKKKLKDGDTSRDLAGGIHPTMRGIETQESLGMGRSS